MNKLTHERLLDLLQYNVEDGIFIWKIKRKKGNIGAIAGTIGRNGYRIIGIDNKLYLAHRLAWFYVHKTWPEFVIDHINHNKLDNRIMNLRSVTQKENGKNILIKKSNASSANGVRFRSGGRKNPWQARVMHDKKEISLGHYSTFEEALLAREQWDQNFWSQLN
jgi:hypothetical protein